MIGTLFGTFFGALIIKIPIGAALGLSLVAAHFLADGPNLEYLARTYVQSLDSFPVLAIPLFILAGEIMGKGGISHRLFNVANSLMGRFTGGVAMATVLTCMLFGAISGSANATFAAVGGIMIPTMVKNGYDKNFVTALTAASGGLGVIIPPSIPMVMYGIATGTSIGDIFIAGIIPGCVIGGCLMFYAWLYCKKKGYKAAATEVSTWQSLREGFWALLTPVIILGGIYGGVFTPTEAAGVAVIYSVMVSVFIYRSLRFRDLWPFLTATARMVSPILLIVAGATVFGRILTIENVPAKLTAAMMSVSENPLIILLMINILLLITGMLMETLASVVILAPILLPIAVSIGVDPVHFGIIMIANLAIGYVTPPVGMNLYLASSMMGIPIQDLSKAVLLPVVFMLVAQIPITIFPALSLLLVNFFK